MLIPSAFAQLAVLHGTIGTISDPHEIANVCGIEGVHYMIENGKKVPFHFFFGAPSCVPATIFETAGASINSQEVATLLANKDIYYLSEMMNFPGVLFKDEEVMKKIKAAHAAGKPVAVTSRVCGSMFVSGIGAPAACSYITLLVYGM